MAESSSSSSGGIGFVGLLTIVFIVLKLIGKIDWSWWWVLSPLWISAALAILAVCFFGGIALAVAMRKPLPRKQFTGARRTALPPTRITSAAESERAKENSFLN